MRIKKTKQRMGNQTSDFILNSINFHKEIKESKFPVMVDFYADWCGPCKLIAPAIEELSKEYMEKVKIFKLNVDNARDIAGEFNISSIPTVIIFKEGKPVDQFVGALPKTNIKNFIKKNI